MMTVSPRQPSRAAPESDADFCRAALPKVSRTFALSIEALPEGLREPVRTAYLLCRIVDTVEDQAGLLPGDRARLYDGFDAALGAAEPGEIARLADRFACLATDLGLDADGAGGSLCRGSGAVFRQFSSLSAQVRGAIAGHVSGMSTGMREFSARSDAVGRLRLRDVPDLERYCYFVAGTVGELLTSLFELEVVGLTPSARDGLQARAVSFGLGLQMVNIVKDVAEDHLRGDVFLPESLARAEGIELEQLLEPAHRAAGRRVVGAVSNIAREHLERAREYALLWPPETGASVRLFCAVPLALALATLFEVDHGDHTLLRGASPKVSRGAVARIFLEAGAAIQDDARLDQLFSRAAAGEFR